MVIIIVIIPEICLISTATCAYTRISVVNLPASVDGVKNSIILRPYFGRIAGPSGRAV